MTDDEIKAAIAAEGGLVVGNWTYTANDELVKQFQKYVKATYGADIKLTYEGTQAPSEYLTKLAAAKAGGNPAPYDVIAVEENYWADAIDQGLVDDVLPVGPDPEPEARPRHLQARPDVDRLPVDRLPGRRLQQGQGAAAQDAQGPRRPARSRARSRCRRPATSRRAASCSASPRELGKDYKDPDQMKEVVDWAVDEHRTERPQVHDRPVRAAAAVRVGRGRRGDASGTAWPGSSTSAATRTRRCSCPTTIYPVNGYLWIPKGAAAPGARPDLHQLAARPGRPVPERLADRPRPVERAQRGLPWPGLREPGPRLVHKDYFTYFPTLDQIKTSFQTVDWKAYNASPRSGRTTTRRRSVSRLTSSGVPAPPRAGTPLHRPGGSMTAEPIGLALPAIAPEVRRRERNRRLVGARPDRCRRCSLSSCSSTTRSCSSSR